jgi:hypothetical protein
MYAGSMFDEEANPVLARAAMATEQAERTRNLGMAGGLATVSWAG